MNATLFSVNELSPVTLEAQIKAVERELGFRDRVYKRRVAEAKMQQQEADNEIAAMNAVLRTLKSLHSGGLVRAAREAQRVLDEIVKGHGACEHDVNYCCCAERNAAAAIEEALR